MKDCTLCSKVLDYTKIPIYRNLSDFLISIIEEKYPTRYFSPGSSYVEFHSDNCIWMIEGMIKDKYRINEIPKYICEESYQLVTKIRHIASQVRGSIREILHKRIEENGVIRITRSTDENHDYDWKDIVKTILHNNQDYIGVIVDCDI